MKERKILKLSRTNLYFISKKILYNGHMSKKYQKEKLIQKFFVVIILILMSMLVLVGCQQEEEVIIVEEEEMVIGFSQIQTDWPWVVAQTNSVIAEAELKGYDLVWRDAEGSLDQQKEDVEELIDLGVKYLILVPSDEFGFEGLIRYASQKDVTVIVLGRDARTVTDNIVCIQSDQKLEGEMAAHWLAEQLGGVGKVIEIQGNVGSSSAKYRSEGFYEVMEEYPDIEIIASEASDFTRSGGNDAMENMLRKYSGQIDAVFAHNDEMAIGAIQALKAVGQIPGEDMIFASVDGEKDALKAIIAEELGASVKCTPFLGPMAFEIIDKLEAGQEVEEIYMIETELIYDESNARDYIDRAY